MSEAEAMRQAVGNYIFKVKPKDPSLTGFDFEAGWQEALEWQRGQCKPVAVRFKERPDDMRSSWMYVKNAALVPKGHSYQQLYTSPPTAQINEQMRDALQALLTAVQKCHCENSGPAQELAHAALTASKPKT